MVSPTPRTLLFAALEAQDSSRPYDWDTVAIAGLDGAAQMGGTSNLIYHSVRRADGTEIWGSRAAAGQPYQDPFVSPHGDRVVAGVGGGGIAAIVSSLGDRVALGIHPLGWLDDTTVISGGFDRNFLYASVKAPGNVLEIGLKGAFVGTVQG